MRSSIACARCRRSKVKCVNNGVNTTCRACETTGRECTYPSPATGGGGGGGGVARREGSLSRSLGAEGGSTGETPRRYRPKKTAPAQPIHTASKDSHRAIIDALDPNLLTPKLWIELFEIYQTHFSTDIPFLHPPTFLKPLRQSALAQPPPQPQGFSHSPDQAAPIFPPASPVLLLAFLSLTARFHPQLVSHHSPASASRPSNPIIASEYYAAAARSRLSGNLGDALGTPDLERVQALLMLTLHDWGNCNGAKAWVSLGVAIRYAQILGLHYERDLDDQPYALSNMLTVEADRLGMESRIQPARPGSKSNSLIEEEIRRRTFWSCYIMDRYISSGKYRPQMIHNEQVRIQLPSSDRAFLFGEKVRTLTIGEDESDAHFRGEGYGSRRTSLLLTNGGLSGSVSAYPATPMSQDSRAHPEQRDDPGRWEAGADEGVLSRYIRVTELYGKLVKWSLSGGRRREKHPPWDARSGFYDLNNLVRIFKDRLPPDLTLSTTNISAHITSRTSTPYVLMHTTLLLCNIVLHREYIPFIPLRCSKPQGPLDPPLFSPEEYQIPPRFWEESARTLFSSCRETIDLLRTSQEWGGLMETPIIGFTLYTVAFIGVYAINFPWMDPDGFMCKQTRGGPQESGDRGAEAARKALEMIGQMRLRLRMANGWFKTIKRTHVYFSRIRKDFRRNVRSLSDASGDSHSNLSVREGGMGGGLEEFKLLEMTLKDFGSLEDEDMEMIDAPNLDRGDGRTFDDRSEGESFAMKSERMNEGTPDSSVRQDRWNAINNVAAAASSQRPDSSGYALPPGGPGRGVMPSGVSPPLPHQFSHTADSRLYSGPSPMVSPSTQSISASSVATPYTTVQGQTYSLPGGPSLSNPSPAPLQQQPPPPQTPVPQEWTHEMKESWLNGLNTQLGGDDLAAFVQGSDWEDWAGAGAPGAGWLSVVWSGGVGGGGH
ncbi:hypothetical protein K402DRAFT_272454 [Aulographum hederae CBS 113979]|uniref:Zn(2)-C6 fungal-type domain-containing protein n=1 Tax=Aulographum hederae CBS 113979 TaxID=1176131 RepID=A0A6G1H8U1_9PEZI|nr:hypothetical protein K402DRAFT_272454 [Aulographum hederae CBS 113979]